MTAVVGAVGGVGASTLAALLCRRRAAEGRPAVLVDLDLGRGGIEVLLGIERTPGIRWPDLAGVRGTLAASDLDGLLPSWRGIDVLSAARGRGSALVAGTRDLVVGDREGADVGWVAGMDDARASGVDARAAGGVDARAADVLAVRAGGVDAGAVAAVLRGLVASGREVVADLPVAVAVSRNDLLDLLGAQEVLLVTGQDVLGVAGAAAARDVVGPDARLVLRRRASARVAPAEAARALGLRLAGVVPTDRGVAGATDRGLGPTVPSWSALARAVRRLERVGP